MVSRPKPKSGPKPQETQVTVLFNKVASVSLMYGNSLLLLPQFPDNYFDAVVTDPPYDLTDKRDPRRGFPAREEGTQEWSTEARTAKGFMGREWDGTGIAFNVDLWKEVFRVLKPGGHLVAFGGTRTYHRLACAIEDAGGEIRDMFEWFYGSGFPKDYDAAKGIEALLTTGNASWNDFHRLNGKKGPEDSRGANGMVHENARQGSRPRAYVSHGTLELDATTELAKKYAGYGTALKPGHEPIVLARKPLSEPNIASNIIKWGTGALNIDACRLPYASGADRRSATPQGKATSKVSGSINTPDAARDVSRTEFARDEQLGRWPPNVLMSHHNDCRPLGLRRIKNSSGRASGPTFGKFGTNVAYGPAHGSEDTLQPKYHGDENGHEIMQAWECHEDCPIGQLDGQHKGASRYFPNFSYTEYDDLSGITPFFYSGKASKSERNAGLAHLPTVKVNDGRTTEIDNPYQRAETERKNPHPTVKPVSLMRWLCRLVTPEGGVILEPFMGSGTTPVAGVLENFSCVGMDMEADYLAVAAARVKHAEKVQPKVEVQIVHEDDLASSPPPTTRRRARARVVQSVETGDKQADGDDSEYTDVEVVQQVTMSLVEMVLTDIEE